MEKIIEVKNLRKNFGKNEVLHDINLTVNRGEVVSLIGPSGSGKSTILRCIIDLETITDRDIFIEGKNLKDKKLKKEILLKTGMVFQSFNLFPHMTVRNNIVRTLKLVKKSSVSEATKIVKEVLEVVGLADKIDNFPSELSGGQRQRVALDPELVKEVLDIIRKLKNEKITMLIVSHEMNFVKEISDKVVVLENGKILEKGTSKQIFENPESSRVKEFLNTIY